MMEDSEAVKAALDRGTIVTDLNVKTKEEVFEALAVRLKEQGYIESVDLFLDALHDREKEGATGIGGHVAIPHGRSDTVKKNGIAIAVLHDEIAWESLDDTGAKVVVLFAVGATDAGSQEHLKLLSLLARRLAKADVVADLLKADNVDDVIAALTK
jgi:fructose PTS system EIIA component